MSDGLNGADDVASMTVLDHLREASRLMEGPDVAIEDYDAARADNNATAANHLAFAQALLLIHPNMQRPASTWLARSLTGFTEEDD